MRKQSGVRRTLAAAAMTGLLAGAGALLVGCQNKQQDNTTQPGMSASSGGSGDMAMAKHDCKGQNSCKGQGGCKSADNSCKGQNSCKGKGGCKTNGQ